MSAEWPVAAAWPPALAPAAELAEWPEWPVKRRALRPGTTIPAVSATAASLNSISTSLGGIPAALMSGSNPSLSYPILNLSLLGFAVTGTIIFVWFMRKTKFEPAEIA